MAFFVCIVASQRNGPIYVGHTDDLSKRIWEHREGVIEEENPTWRDLYKTLPLP